MTTANLPRQRWLLSENLRSIVSTVIALLAAGLVLGLLFTQHPQLRGLARTDPIGRTVVICAIGWVCIVATHTLLTWFAYRRLHGAAFGTALLVDSPETRDGGLLIRWTRALGGDSTSWIGTFSVLSLIVVAGLVLRPGLRAIPVMLAIGLVMVVLSWLNLVLQFAIEYARLDHSDDAFSFPGEQPESLSGYLYLSFRVQTSFASNDVAVLTDRARRFVTQHGVLAFLFNTVIIAMLVSLVVGLA